ncbi:hypothetical protein RJ640_022718 [Escallonia rubra]|uniref:Uncharacterized protein n=1 Tax=Escallonia rubra TaxID=112253 RepID=A0AA88U7Q9_9ASTE|nr:hypothetical protein RJ640_022718 [Escallonia rubra]
MVTLRYSESSGVHEHILRMNDMASQLKGLDMKIFGDVHIFRGGQAQGLIFGAGWKMRCFQRDGTNYAAYLVFKLAQKSYGLQTAKAAIRLINQREDVPFNEADIVCLDFQSSAHERRQQNEQISRERRDWWVEIKMGEFMNEQGDYGEVEARLIETHGGKSGLIVEGTEFRLNKEPI